MIRTLCWAFEKILWAIPVEFLKSQWETKNRLLGFNSRVIANVQKRKKSIVIAFSLLLIIVSINSTFTYYYLIFQVIEISFSLKNLKLS
jgi:hypothetical protein